MPGCWAVSCFIRVFSVLRRLFGVFPGVSCRSGWGRARVYACVGVAGGGLRWPRGSWGVCRGCAGCLCPVAGIPSCAGVCLAPALSWMTWACGLAGGGRGAGLHGGVRAAGVAGRLRRGGWGSGLEREAASHCLGELQVCVRTPPAAPFTASLCWKTVGHRGETAGVRAHAPSRLRSLQVPAVKLQVRVRTHFMPLRSLQAGPRLSRCGSAGSDEPERRCDHDAHGARARCEPRD